MRPTTILLVALGSTVVSATPALRWSRGAKMDHQAFELAGRTNPETTSSCDDMPSTSKSLLSKTRTFSQGTGSGYLLPTTGYSTKKPSETLVTYVTTTTTICPVTQSSGTQISTYLKPSIITVTSVATVTSCSGGCENPPYPLPTTTMDIPFEVSASSMSTVIMSTGVYSVASSSSTSDFFYGTSVPAPSESSSTASADCSSTIDMVSSTATEDPSSTSTPLAVTEVPVPTTSSSTAECPTANCPVPVTSTMIITATITAPAVPAQTITITAPATPAKTITITAPAAPAETVTTTTTLPAMPPITIVSTVCPSMHSSSSAMIKSWSMMIKSSKHGYDIGYTSLKLSKTETPCASGSMTSVASSTTPSSTVIPSSMTIPCEGSSATNTPMSPSSAMNYDKKW